MHTVTDEQLMAYVDGELDEADVRKVESALARDPSLQRRAALFSSSTNILTGAFDGELERPVPKKFEELLGSPSLWTRLRSTAAKFLGAHEKSGSPALSMALLLFLGVTLSVLLIANPTPQSNPVVSLTTNATWHAGFETTPSGTSFTFLTNDDVTLNITPSGTFLDVNEQFCRSFAVTTHNNNSVRGLACRVGDNEWSNEFTLSAEARSQPSETSMVTASETSDPFQRMMEVRMSTAFFGPVMEQKVLASGWLLKP